MSNKQTEEYQENQREFLVEALVENMSDQIYFYSDENKQEALFNYESELGNIKLFELEFLYKQHCQ